MKAGYNKTTEVINVENIKAGYNKTVEVGKQIDGKLVEYGVYTKANQAFSAGAALLGTMFTNASNASKP